MQWSDTATNTGILQEIRRSLRQPSTGGHWLDTDLLRRANIVMREICAQTECLKLIDTSNASVSGTAEYNKPAGCSRIVRVAYGNNRLFGIMLSELDARAYLSAQQWQTLTAAPGRYYEKPTSVVIVPTPSDTGTTITIEYIAQPTELANVTDIPFNAQNNLYAYHDLIVAGVLYRCLLEDKNAFYAEWKSTYKDGIKTLRQVIKDMPDTMMTSLDMGSGGGRNIGPLPLGRGY